MLMMNTTINQCGKSNKISSTRKVEVVKICKQPLRELKSTCNQRLEMELLQGLFWEQNARSIMMKLLAFLLTVYIQARHFTTMTPVDLDNICSFASSCILDNIIRLISVKSKWDLPMLFFLQNTRNLFAEWSIEGPSSISRYTVSLCETRTSSALLFQHLLAQ